METKESAHTYTPTIGLEIHTELKTRTKMFCSCANSADEKAPNTNICPVCMAHPGTLPVINREAVKKVLLVGVALGSTLADYTEFDRKNYFYPDIPKGYQISQYAYPLVKGGSLQGVDITRIHLEEDTARSQHTGEKSLVDYNRAGLPLMELVTEPVIHDAETAGRFARELQLLLRAVGAGDANMEKGEMRVEANISVSPNASLGTKVEVKNLNSFRNVERAIAFEIERQIKLIEEGGKVVQETRGWDEGKQATFAQRKKESSEDYRYFPEPDLPKLVISEIPEFSYDVLEKELPELPSAKRERYTLLGLKSDDADMFVIQPNLGIFFDSVSNLLKDQKLELLAANYIANDIASEIAEKSGEVVRVVNLLEEKTLSNFAELIRMAGGGELSSRATKDILGRVVYEGQEPRVLAEREGLMQQNDAGALTATIQKIIEANPVVVASYKAGKEASLQFLIGQGMKETKGSANPALLKELFIKLLQL